MGGAVIDIKVKHTNKQGEVENRKLAISQYIKWSELETQLREVFDIADSQKVALSFVDEHDDDLILVSSDGEISRVLESLAQEEGSKVFKFNLVVRKAAGSQIVDCSKIHTSDHVVETAKNILGAWFNDNLPKVVEQVVTEVVSKIDHQRQREASGPTAFTLAKPKTFIYPAKKLAGADGEAVELRIPADYLTFTHASNKTIWGTGIYTADSDPLKALGHSGIYMLPKQAPAHDLAVTLRFLPGCKKYFGSTNNTLRSEDFNQYRSSFVIESVKEIPKGSAS